MTDLGRRDFLGRSLGFLAAPVLPACWSSAPGDVSIPSARLTARPGTPTETSEVGLTSLGLGGERDGLLYLPTGYSPDTPAPLFVALHGAGGRGSNWQSYPDRAEARGMVLLAPDSRDRTWDAIYGTFGADVTFLDAALKYTFARCRIDPARIALGGFSDGASYALSLGLHNADLFSHLVAYSPGFLGHAGELLGKPPVYVSHGTQDSILFFETTRDRIVPALRDIGLEVTFREFEGGHEVPSEISDEALDWFTEA